MTRERKIARALDAETGDLVGIASADPDRDYTCPGCLGELKFVSAHSRNGHRVRKHFSHKSETCGHESDTHIIMKQIAAEYAADRWPDAEVANEDDGDTTLPNGRVPDVRVDFDEPRDGLGDGVCIECQYKNKSKDIDATEEDYAEQGYSTAWTRAHRPDRDGNYSITRVREFFTDLVPDHPDEPGHEHDFDLEHVVVPVALTEGVCWDLWGVSRGTSPVTHRDLLPDEPDHAEVPVSMPREYERYVAPRTHDRFLPDEPDENPVPVALPDDYVVDDVLPGVWCGSCGEYTEADDGLCGNCEDVRTDTVEDILDSVPADGESVRLLREVSEHVGSEQQLSAALVAGDRVYWGHGTLVQFEGVTAAEVRTAASAIETSG